MHVRRSLVAFLALATLVLAGCSADERPPDVTIEFPTPTPASVERTPSAETPATAAASTPARTPTAAPTSVVAAACPVAEDACAFGLRIAANLVAGQGDAILAVSRPTTYTCPGPNGGLGDPFPLCNGARNGETREGYPFLTTFQGQGSVMGAQQAAILLSDWSARANPALRDDFGDGAPRGYSVACPGIAPDAPGACTEAFSFVFSGLVSAPDGPLRWMAAVSVRRLEDGTLRADGFATGVAAAAWDLTYPLRGGSGGRADPRFPAILAPAFPPASTVTFFPWDPAGAP